MMVNLHSVQYISDTARIYEHKLYLEISVQNGDWHRMARSFQCLFWDEAEYCSVIVSTFQNAGITDTEILEDLIAFGTLSDENFGKLIIDIRAIEQSDRATAITEVLREAEDEIVTQLSPKTRLRKWNERIWTEVLKLVKLELGDRIDDTVSPEESTSPMDRSVESATKTRRFFIASRGFVGLGPADLGKGNKVFLLKGGQKSVHFLKYS